MCYKYTGSSNSASSLRAGSCAIGHPTDLQVWNFIYLHINSENVGKISDKNQILGQNED